MSLQYKVQIHFFMRLRLLVPLPISWRAQAVPRGSLTPALHCQNCQKLQFGVQAAALSALMATFTHCVVCQHYRSYDLHLIPVRFSKPQTLQLLTVNKDVPHRNTPIPRGKSLVFHTSPHDIFMSLETKILISHVVMCLLRNVTNSVNSGTSVQEA